MKIAFCFLTYNEIIRYDVWNTFFENIDEKLYTVFIHPKNVQQYYNYTFKYNIVKNIVSTERKDDINIVNATLRLLEETYNYDLTKNITHFIFLTQSCIPLYSFETLYKIITMFPSSVISYIDNNKKERYYQLSSIIKKNINPKNFVKQQPNMILTKDDVKLLINNNLTEHFKYMQCPDEHYFVNILSNIFKRKFIIKQTHFCNPDLHKTQALEYNIVNKFFIDNIRKHGFLFMRKVTIKTDIDIDFLFNI
jgi:hypothetical protein